MCKIDLFQQRKHNNQLFLQILVKFLRNNIKYTVSSAVLGVISGALKVAFLRLDNPQFPADLVTFTGEILNGKLYFLCGVRAVPVQGAVSDDFLK